MTPNSIIASEDWLSGQGGFVEGLLEETLDEMQSKGFRMRVGSTPLTVDSGNDHKRASIVPVRFSHGGGDILRLSVEATTSRNHARYVVALEARGEPTVAGLRKLALGNPEAWEEAYLRAGLWIRQPGGSQPLQHLSQIEEQKRQEVQIAAAFPPLQVRRTMKHATMILGILYRSAIDELSECSRMANLVARLKFELGGYLPRFQRVLPP